MSDKITPEDIAGAWVGLVVLVVTLVVSVCFMVGVVAVTVAVVRWVF